jgi:tripartite-type tricarboxylate transporter receptor subunit TctC
MLKSDMTKLGIAVLAVVASVLFTTAAAFAQAYPTKPVRIIVPFPPGGGNDVIARIIGQKLTERWGQQVIIDNRAGANGIVGLQLLMQSPPDGYTLAVAAAGPIAVNPSLYEKLPYDSVRDFAPITNMTNFPLLLVIHPSMPVKNVRELIALAKAQPGKINYASPGSGNSGHLAGELFNNLAVTKIVHIPYKGNGPAITGLLSGQAQLLFSSIPSVLPFVEAKKLNAIAVGSAKRIPSLPAIPTIAESGLPKYEAYSWVGIVAPAKTPRDIVAKVNHDIVDILKVKQVGEQLVQQGALPVGDSPDEFAAYIKTEIQKWGAIVKSANIKAD